MLKRLMRWVLSGWLLVSVVLVAAQEDTLYQCGDNLVGTLQSGASSALHRLNIASGTILIVRAEPLPIDAERSFDLQITSEGGFVVTNIDYAPEDLSTTVETSPLLRAGVYDIRVTSDEPGDYQLFISCVDEDGVVTSGNNLVNPLVCGMELDNPVIRPDALHRYYIALERDDILAVRAITLEGEFGEMTIDTGLISPSNQELDSINPMFKGIERVFDTGPLPENGVYRFYLRAFDAADSDYRLSVDCTLADGQVIIAGQVPRIELTPTILEPVNTENAVPTPTAEAPANLADTIEQSSAGSPTPEVLADRLPDGVSTPLIPGTPNTGSLSGGDAFRYTFDGTTGNRLVLEFTRLSGDLNLGLVVLAESDTIIFEAYLNETQSLMLTSVLPEDGAYTIVVYDRGMGGTMTAFTVQGTLEE